MSDTKKNTKEQLGDYEMVQLLGDGAQGRVFKARRVVGAVAGGPEFYAVKVLRFSGDDKKKLSRFQKSAETLQKLTHPSIVGYYGSYSWHSGEWDEAHCLVMEYLDGVSLDEIIKKKPRGMPWLEVKPIFEACLEGLIYARSQGIIHRDIKPSNIFITRTGQTKLIDFDIAKREDDSQASTAGWRGTFDYMAPDFVQVDDFHGDEQSDIFSLGVCLFQTLTGRLPFPQLGEGAHIGYLSRWHDASAAKPAIDAGIFRALVNARQMVANCLQPLRANRTKTFQEMLDALRTVQFRRLEHKGGDTYELIDWLGRGGFGEVYLGRRLRDGTLVAVKRLSAKECSSRFVKEAQIIQKYPHDALVQYVDFVEVSGRDGEKQLFLVLEYLEGMPYFSLSYRLKDDRRIPPREAARLFIRYLSALQFLHENSRPIIHRDIKPGNLYAPRGKPDNARIFDLGIARDVDGTATTGTIPGTLDYMAPETLTEGGDRGTPQTDIFALGLCLYESLTGNKAFPKLPSELSKAMPILQERANKPFDIDYSNELFKEFPAFEIILKKALQQDPKKRYAKASLMKRDLELLLPRLPQDAKPDGESTIVRAPDFVRGDDAPAAPDADDETTAKGPVIAAPSAGGPGAEKKEAAKSSRMLPLIVIAVIVIAAGVGTAVYLRSQSRTETAVTAPTIPAPPPVETETPFRVDAKFATPSASSAYVTALGAEIARIDKGIGDGSLRGSAVKQALETLENQAAGMPQVFLAAFNAALVSKDDAAATALIDDWAKTQSSAKLLGLTVPQHDSRTQEMKALLGSHQLDATLAAIRGAIPANPAAEGAWTQTEKAATKLDEVRARDWTGIAADDRNARIASVASALRSVVDLRLASATTLPQLEELKTQSPHLAKQFGENFDRRGAAIAKGDKGREQFQTEMNDLLAAVPADTSSAAELGRAEEVASKIKDLPARVWPGVSDTEKLAALSRIREALLPVMAATVANLRGDALKQVRTAASADALRAPLVDLEHRYPNATAFVASAHRKALQDVDAAWKARPPPEPVVAPVVPVKPVVTNVPATVATTTPAVVVPVTDPNEEAAIKALVSGGTSFAPKGKATFDMAKINELLALAAPVRRDLKGMDLILSPKPAQDYLASVDDFWKMASSITGDFGARVRTAAWQVIDGQMAACADTTIKGAIRSSPPSQQARVRREFIKLISRIDEMTAGRVAACPEQDALRVRVALYFADGFFNDALLTEKVGGDAYLERQIPWIKDFFDKLRAKRGIKAAVP